MRRSVGGEFFFQQAQRIGMFAFRDRGSADAGRFVNLHLPFVRLKTKKRTGAEEAVPSQPFAADHALEEKRPVPFLNLAEGADGSQRVADKLAINRNQTGVGCER